jgi:hypothetical protein
MAPRGYSWKITDQQVDQTRNDSSGNTLVGSLIYYRTGDGNNGVVFITNNLLTLEHVKEIVRADARLRDDIGRLYEGDIT